MGVLSLSPTLQSIIKVCLSGREARHVSASSFRASFRTSHTDKGGVLTAVCAASRPSVSGSGPHPMAAEVGAPHFPGRPSVLICKTKGPVGSLHRLFHLLRHGSDPCGAGAQQPFTTRRMSEAQHRPLGQGELPPAVGLLPHGPGSPLVPRLG